MTNAFWKVLSPQAKEKTNKKVLLSTIISGNCAIDIGASPIIESATIQRVVIGSREILVVADIKWDFETRRWYGRNNFRDNENIYKMKWIKIGRSYYLSTGLIKGDSLLMKDQK